MFDWFKHVWRGEHRTVEAPAPLERNTRADTAAQAHFVNCPVCHAKNSVLLPPDAEPGADGKVDRQLASSCCTACGLIATFDVTGGREVRLPEVEWENWCAQCDRRGDLVPGEIFLKFTGPTLVGSPRPPQPGLRWAWCPGCEKDVFMITKSAYQLKLRNEAKKARQQGKLQ